MNPVRAVALALSLFLILSQIRPGPVAEADTWMAAGLFRGLLLFVVALVIAVVTAITLSRMEGKQANG